MVMKDLSLRAVVVLAALVSSVTACRRSASTEANDAGSAPTIVAAARAVDGCKWIEKDSQGYGFADPACPAMTSWETSFGENARLYESELIDLLTDPQRGARWVAARDLDRVLQPRWNKDEALSRRVLARVAAETDPSVAHRVGVLVGSVDLADGKFSAPVLAALGPGSSPHVRAGVADHVLARNPKDAAVIAAVVDLARTAGPPGPRIEGLRALAYQSEGTAACEVVLQASRDPDALVSAEASTLTTARPMLKACPENVAGVLSALSARSALTERHVAALDRIAEVASPGQKKQTIAILRRVVETKAPEADADARRAAFVVLRERDPDVKAFAPAFLHDENILLRSEAAEVMGVEVSLGVLPTDAGSDAMAPRRGADGGR